MRIGTVMIKGEQLISIGLVALLLLVSFTACAKKEKHMKNTYQQISAEEANKYLENN